MKTDVLPDRIERKIVRVPFSGCWIWIGSGNRYGYVHFNGKVQRAHRAIFQLFGNVIPDGLEVMHSCDVGVCVNPNHLSVGSHLDNMSDMSQKGRAKAPIGVAHWTNQNRAKARAVGIANIKKSHKAGVHNNNAKVTLEMLHEVREAHKQSPSMPMVELGVRFGIGRETARKIVKGVSPWNQ